jgi:hypothetical protein
MMSIFTVFTTKDLKAGEELEAYADKIPIGAQVVFKRPTDTLNPIARGTCIGRLKPFMTPSKRGKKKDAYRFYKRFRVEEEA